MKFKSGEMKRVFGLLLAAALLAGCQRQNNSAPISSATGLRFAANQATAYNTGSLPGRIYADPSQQAGFQQAAVGFLSTDVPPQYVGMVSAAGTGNSGIRFGGQVGLSSGSLRTYDGSYATLDPRSQIIIQVFDQANQYGQVPPIPPLRFSSASGMISGNQVQVTFSDTYGSVTLQGYINTPANTFDGYASYDNNVRWDGSSPGSAGNLGNFTVPLCNFFVCN